MSEFSQEDLPIERALRAKNILSTLNLESVVAVSAGAATFYVWVRFYSISNYFNYFNLVAPFY